MPPRWPGHCPARRPAGPGPARLRSGAAAARGGGTARHARDAGRLGSRSSGSARCVRRADGPASPRRPGRPRAWRRPPRRTGARRGNAPPRHTWPRRGPGWRGPPSAAGPASGTAGGPGGPLSGFGLVAGGQGCGGGREEQFRLLVRYPALRRQSAERGHGLLRRFFGQPGGQQCQAAVDEELGNVLAEIVIAAACIVEVGERLGEIAADERHTCAVVPGLGEFELLPAAGEHLLGPGEFRGCAPGQAEPEEDLGSMCQRSGLPYRVGCPAEVGQSAAQVLVCLVETAKIFKDGGTPHEHPAGQVSARGGHCPVQYGQSLLAAPRPREGQPQGRLHVDLTLGPA